MKPMRSEIPLAEAGGDWMQKMDGNEMRLQSCDMMTDCLTRLRVQVIAVMMLALFGVWSYFVYIQGTLLDFSV